VDVSQLKIVVHICSSALQMAVTWLCSVCGFGTSGSESVVAKLCASLNSICFAILAAKFSFHKHALFYNARIVLFVSLF
jgi:hypothetical protein